MFRNLTFHFPKNLTEQELKQNNGHIFQLSERAKNFNECFLGLKIEIEIFYELDLPSCLILKYKKDGIIEKIEEYYKLIYIDSFGVKRYGEKTILKIINNDGTSKSIGKFFDVSKNN